MYVCMYVYVCIYIYTYTYIQIYIYMCTNHFGQLIRHIFGSLQITFDR